MLDVTLPESVAPVCSLGAGGDSSPALGARVGTLDSRAVERWRGLLLVAMAAQFVMPFVHAAVLPEVVRRSALTRELFVTSPHATLKVVQRIAMELPLPTGPAAIGGALAVLLAALVMAAVLQAQSARTVAPVLMRDALYVGAAYACIASGLSVIVWGLSVGFPNAIPVASQWQMQGALTPNLLLSVPVEWQRWAREVDANRFIAALAAVRVAQAQGLRTARAYAASVVWPLVATVLSMLLPLVFARHVS